MFSFSFKKTLLLTEQDKWKEKKKSNFLETKGDFNGKKKKISFLFFVNSNGEMKLKIEVK